MGYVPIGRMNLYVENDECHLKMKLLKIYEIYVYSAIISTPVKVLKHKDSFGKEIFLKFLTILHLIGHYPKYFQTNFTLWTEVRLTIC